MMRKFLSLAALATMLFLPAQGKANDSTSTVLDYDIFRTPCRVYLANLNTNNDVEKHILTWAHGYWSASDMFAFRQLGHSLFPQTGNIKQDSINAEKKAKEIFTNICREKPDISIIIAATDTLTTIAEQ